MAKEIRWSFWAALFLLLRFAGVCWSHVALTYPPARQYDLDFLDSGRTKSPCGMPKGDIVTSFPPGATINVTWHLGYPHRGGFKLELLDQNERILRDLTPTTLENNYIGSGDSTAQHYIVTFPHNLVCKGCTLRLLRQAQEWGPRFLFWSCADVDIVPEFSTVCSGNGKIENGRCRCNHLYSGSVCQYKDECWTDSDCGLHGKCINIDATSYPKMQCYCEYGWFGERCDKESPVKKIDFSKYTRRDLSDEMTLYWRILEELGEIEAVMKVKGTNYAAIGWRPYGLTASCKSFPVVVDRRSGSRQFDVTETTASVQTKTETVTTKRVQEQVTTESTLKNETPRQTTIIFEPTTEASRPTLITLHHLSSEATTKPTVTVQEFTTEGKVLKPSIRATDSTVSLSQLKTEGEIGRSFGFQESTTERATHPSTIFTEPVRETKPVSTLGSAEYASEDKKVKLSGFSTLPTTEWEGSKPSVRSLESGTSTTKEESETPQVSLDTTLQKEILLSTGNTGSGSTATVTEAISQKATTTSQKATTLPITIETSPEPTSGVTYELPNTVRSTLANAAVQSTSQTTGAENTESITYENAATSTTTHSFSRQKREMSLNANVKPEIPWQPEISGSSNNDVKHVTNPGSYGTSDIDSEDFANQEVGSNREKKQYSVGDRRYPVRSPYTPRADFHAMDCSDIVIGMARGTASRIHDYYTRDRSTPRQDTYFGGTDSLTAALGYEENGETVILFRKKLQAQELSDHTIAPGLMDVIWAMGQKPDAYSHHPATGLEAGKASVPDFYRMDELKYHGHGKQRGKLSLNFFELDPQPSKNSCQGEWKYPSGCQNTACEYQAKWRYLEKTDEIVFGVSTNNTDRWTGLAFSKNMRMANSDAVIGWVQPDGIFTIMDMWLSGYTQPLLDREQNVYNAFGVRQDGVTTLQFVRRRNTGDLSGQDLTFSDNECLYFFFPVKGGKYDPTSKRVIKHERTPMVSSKKICISKCANDEMIVAPPPSRTTQVQLYEPEPEKPAVIQNEQPTSRLESTPSSDAGLPAAGPEPYPAVNDESEASPCKGEWKYPSTCQLYDCSYRATWEYVDQGDEIVFTISTRNHNKWTGIAFSKKRAMPQTDAILGLVDEQGHFFIMDTWLHGYEAPELDRSQDVYNTTGWRENGVTSLRFVRRRITADAMQDYHFTDEECLYMIFPVQGGLFNAVNKKIRKHEATPIISESKICIRSCHPRLEPPPQVFPEPAIPEEPFEESPPSYGEDIYQLGTEHSIPRTTPSSLPAVPPEPLQYAVKLKIRNSWRPSLKQKTSKDYKNFETALQHNIKAALKDLNALQQIDLMDLKENQDDPSSVIAHLNVILDTPPLEANSNNDENMESQEYLSEEFESALNATVSEGRIGNLPVDPAYLVIHRISGIQEGEPSEVPDNGVKQETGILDEQTKIYIIAGGVAALVALAVIQAICMVCRERKGCSGPSKKEKLIANSHWKDYSATASSNYSYENFAMKDDDGKISKHPVGTMSNGSAMSHPSARGGSNGVSHQRHTSERGLPYNGHSATFERASSKRTDGFSAYSAHSASAYATHDRSHRSMGNGIRPHPQELSPDFYFMPHQRRYSGEVVRVYVDYNNPEYSGK